MGVVARVPVDHVACTTAADVIDGSGTTQLTLEFLVEAEDGTLAAAVDVACATASRLESAGNVGVKTGERGGASGRSRVGGLRISQADHIPCTAARGMNGGTAGVRDGWVRLDDTVGS